MVQMSSFCNSKWWFYEYKDPTEQNKKALTFQDFCVLYEKHCDIRLCQRLQSYFVMIK